MKLLVCGGRNYHDIDFVYDILNEWLASHPDLEIIQGGASGADKCAQVWANVKKVPVTTYRADWSQGKAGGPLRNQKMLDEGKPDKVLAFPGGKGTQDMVTRAHKQGIPIYEVRRSD